MSKRGDAAKGRIGTEVGKRQKRDPNTRRFAEPVPNRNWLTAKGDPFSGVRRER